MANEPASERATAAWNMLVEKVDAFPELHEPWNTWREAHDGLVSRLFADPALKTAWRDWLRAEVEAFNDARSQR